MTYFISSSWWAREATTLLRDVTILRISARNSRFPSVVFSSSLVPFANMLVALTDESLSDLVKEKATAEFTLSPLNWKEKLLCSVLKQIKNQCQMRKMMKMDVIWKKYWWKKSSRELGIAVMHANEEVSPLAILVRRFVTEKCRQEEGQNWT